MLAPRARIGSFEILAPLGAGGMGEVYRARDTRLGREVAVKVLPGERLSDPTCRARFVQEANWLASRPRACCVRAGGSSSASSIAKAPWAGSISSTA